MSLDYNDLSKHIYAIQLFINFNFSMHILYSEKVIYQLSKQMCISCTKIIQIEHKLILQKDYDAINGIEIHNNSYLMLSYNGKSFSCISIVGKL